jgi:uncharacterized protein (DUF433 family)
MLANGASEAEIVADYPYRTSAESRSRLADAAGMTDHPIMFAAE